MSNIDVIAGMTCASVSGMIITAESEGVEYITYEYADVSSGEYLTAFVEVEVKSLDGECVFVNRASGMYLDVVGQGASDGVRICQREYREETSRWVVSYLDDGYYSIKATSSVGNYYLMDNDDEVILQNASTISENMKWRITRTSLGGYKIESKVKMASGYALSIQDLQGGASGTIVSNTAYSSDGFYNDEWVISEKKAFIISAYYDYEDMSSDDITKCNIAFSVLSPLFEQYGIAFAVGNTYDAYYLYDSANVSSCPRGMTSACSDACGSCKTSHHKNIIRIQQVMYEQMTYNHIEVLLTQKNIFCTSKTEEHNYLSGGYVYDIGKPTIAIAPVPSISLIDPAAASAKLAILLAHEIMHTLGMPEIAKMDSEHEIDGSTRCLMSYNYESIEKSFVEDVLAGNADLLCSYCSARVIQYDYIGLVNFEER